MGNPHQRPERSELPAEEFGKLLDASNECHDQICIFRRLALVAVGKLDWTVIEHA